MKLKLYCSKTSPYSRKVRVVAHELGLGESIDEMFVDPFAAPTALVAANPLSRIPTLVTEKGESLPDSSLIIEYLQTIGRGLANLPRGRKRWEILRMMHIAEGMIDAAVATVIEKRRPEGIRYTPYLDRQADVVRRSIAVLDLAADQLSPDQIGVAEVTVGVAAAYIDLRMPYIEWRKGHDRLAKWQEQFSQRDSMLATAPPPA